VGRDEPYGWTFMMTLGWMAVAWSDLGIQRIFLPQASAGLAGQDLEEAGVTVRPGAGHPALEAAVAGWERGDDSGLLSLTLHPRVWGPPGFRRRVLEELRRVGRGRVQSYAGLARAAGSARAARAAGNVCASNPVPLLIPCHRVIASSGELGGFMGRPGNLILKAALLEREGVPVMRGKVGREFWGGR